MFVSQQVFVARLRILLTTLVALSTLAIMQPISAFDSVADNAQQIENSELEWHDNYQVAYRQAKQQKKMLLINFVSESSKDDQLKLEQVIAKDASLQKNLGQMVLVRLSSDFEMQIDGKPEKLITQAAFREMHNKPGISVIDLQNESKPYYGNVVSAFPFLASKYYRWRADYLPRIVNLPAGTLTQRTMIWAVRVHPERPASTSGKCDPKLTAAASNHSGSQARSQQQGHQGWSGRFQQISSSTGVYDAKEVVAESWPNQTMIDSCIDCVASWRHSSGHWGAVRSRHRLFGYDIKRGRNGIWYGTGIFAN